MSPWNIRVDGGQADREVERASLLLSDLRSFWPVVTRLFISWESRIFDTEGAFSGRPWAPLSPAYAAWKRQAYPGKKILVRSGALKRAATTPRRLATPTSLTLTIEDAKASKHQEGDGRLPARPLIFSSLPPAARAELAAAAETYVRDLLGRA